MMIWACLLARFALFVILRKNLFLLYFRIVITILPFKTTFAKMEFLTGTTFFFSSEVAFICIMPSSITVSASLQLRNVLFQGSIAVM